MKKLIKIGLWLALAGILIGGGVVYYIFNMPHRNLANEEAAYVLTAQEFYTDFSADETLGNEKYGNKAIQVSGEVVEKNEQEYELTIVLGDSMEGVSCTFDSTYAAENKDKLASIEVGKTASIKGKCDGIDMIMGVVMTRCVLVEE